MSPTTRMAVSSFWEYAAFAANSLVFLLIGIQVSFVNLWGDGTSVLAAALIVLAGRAVAVYTLAPVAVWSEGPIPASWRHVLFWGGLRGALSMALALGLPGDFPSRETLVLLTFGVVLFSLLFQGLSIGALLKRLGLRAGDRQSAEFQRLVALRLGSLGALEELERRAAQGSLGRAEVAEVREEYERRLRSAEEKAAALHEGDPRHQRRREAAVRRLALLAEKSALQEAEAAGLVDSETVRPLLSRINADLAGLQLSLHEH
jgi:CPA1 family monovalent cation:H+ antiporter